MYLSLLQIISFSVTVNFISGNDFKNIKEKINNGHYGGFMNKYEYLFKLYGYTVDTIDVATESYIAYNNTFCIPFSLYTFYHDIYADLGVYYREDKDNIIAYWNSSNTGLGILKEPVGAMCFRLHGFSSYDKRVNFIPFSFYGVHHEYHHSSLQSLLHGLESLST